MIHSIDSESFVLWLHRYDLALSNFEKDRDVGICKYPASSPKSPLRFDKWIFSIWYRRFLSLSLSLSLPHEKYRQTVLTADRNQRAYAKKKHILFIFFFLLFYQQKKTFLQTSIAWSCWFLTWGIFKYILFSIMLMWWRQLLRRYLQTLNVIIFYVYSYWERGGMLEACLPICEYMIKPTCLPHSCYRPSDIVTMEQ